MLFINIPDVQGPSEVTGFEKQLIVDSMQFGMGIGVTSTGPAADRTTSIPSFSELSFTRTSDTATPQLMQLCAGAKPKDKVIITITREDSDAHLALVEITLTNVYVTNLSLSSGGDMPHESFSLNYDTIKVDYTSQKKAGGKQGKTPFGWDIKVNKPI